MPNGKTHRNFNIVVLLFLMVILVSELSNTLVWFFIGGYLAGIFLINPDLDLRFSSGKKNWKILGFIWIPYSWIFKHRGISHNILFGTLTRLIYLAIVGTIVLALAERIFNCSIIIPYSQNFIFALLGLWFSDFLHIFLDKLA